MKQKILHAMLTQEDDLQVITNLGKRYRLKYEANSKGEFHWSWVELGMCELPDVPIEDVYLYL